MTERRESLTSDERALLRRRALVVVPVGVAMGAAVVWMLGSVTADLPVGIRSVFGVFFGGVLLLIVGTHVGSSFEREKVVRRGVVTGKRVGVISVGMSTSGKSPNYYVSLDGDESLVEHWVFQRVHTGQTVDLAYTARLRNLFGVVVISDPGVVATPHRVAAHEEALSGPDRAVLRGHLARALVRRGIGGGMVGFAIWVACLLGFLSARSRQPGLEAFDTLVLARLSPAIGLLVAGVLNRRTWRLLRDLLGGRRHVADEIVRDVVRSNTPLLSPGIVVTGTGLAGDYAWVQTDARWVQCDGAAAIELVSGALVRVVTALRSGIVLELGGVGAPRVRLAWFDWLLLCLAIGALWLAFSEVPGPRSDRG